NGQALLEQRYAVKSMTQIIKACLDTGLRTRPSPRKNRSASALRFPNIVTRRKNVVRLSPVPLVALLQYQSPIIAYLKLSSLFCLRVKRTKFDNAYFFTVNAIKLNAIPRKPYGLVWPHAALKHKNHDVF